MLILSTVVIGQDTTMADIQKGTLTVILTDVPNDDGFVMVALSNSQEDYEAEGEPFMGERGTISQGKAEVAFKEISFGNYAIKVFHDEDADRELDTNFLGIPSEAYGFSNNADGSFGPPAWEDAKFTFSSPADTMYIRVD
jgi:uncharacterized protein (DUF2141 family)